MLSRGRASRRKRLHGDVHMGGAQTHIFDATMRGIGTPTAAPLRPG